VVPENKSVDAFLGSKLDLVSVDEMHCSVFVQAPAVHNGAIQGEIFQAPSFGLRLEVDVGMEAAAHQWLGRFCDHERAFCVPTN
jgi:hypothetical protein